MLGCASIIYIGRPNIMRLQLVQILKHNGAALDLILGAPMVLMPALAPTYKL